MAPASLCLKIDHSRPCERPRKSPVSNVSRRVSAERQAFDRSIASRYLGINAAQCLAVKPGYRTELHVDIKIRMFLVLLLASVSLPEMGLILRNRGHRTRRRASPP